MEVGLKVKCLEKGLAEETILKLEQEMITTSSIFASLESDHLHQLLPKMKVGQHALLLKLWEKEKSQEREPVTEPFVRVSLAEYIVLFNVYYMYNKYIIFILITDTFNYIETIFEYIIL